MSQITEAICRQTIVSIDKREGYPKLGLMAGERANRSLPPVHLCSNDGPQLRQPMPVGGLCSLHFPFQVGVASSIGFGNIAGQSVDRMYEYPGSAIGEPTLPAGFLEALASSNREIKDWLTDRHTRSGLGDNHLQPVMGPAMDGAHYYWLGNRPDKYFTSAELEAEKRGVVGRGFPVADPEELKLVNFTNFFSHRSAYPLRPLAPKHFPGGDEKLELTHRHDVHYSSSPQIREWLAKYQRLFDSSVPPEFLMLSHATYDARAFEQPKMADHLADKSFDQVPASYNPAIIKYLREKMGFSGLIVGDWYNMRAARKFAESYELGFEATPAFKAVFLATMAGIDYIPGLDSANAVHGWETLRTTRPELFVEFENKLNESITRMWNRTGEKTDFKVSNLTTSEKIRVKCYDSQYDWEFKRELSDKPQNRPIMTALMRHGISQSDPYDRTGVITLIQRQLLVEKLAGKRFSPLPAHIRDEKVWFEELMSNSEFRKIYDKINWVSPSAHHAFEKVLATYQ